jgi:CheY-like chemotaxis protein
MEEDILNRGLETIERNARAQTQLIDDLLDMSRIISGKLRLDVRPLQPASFIDAAMETVMPAAVAKGVRLEAALDPHTGAVSGDAERLQQVVWNLLSNAIKFTPRGGRVRVLVELVNSHLEISVADTGEGIAADFLPHVFDRFRQADASTTRKHGGLGLGLAIVKQLVELHGGVVSVKSPGENQGTTFIVRLPLETADRCIDEDEGLPPETPPAGSAAWKSANLSGLTILVVDDEPDTIELLKLMLEDCGALVITAASAAAGLEMIKTVWPDVLVSDIGMADVDGYEFLRRVRALGGREEGGGVPAAIALTAFARPEDRTRALLVDA